MPHRWRVLLVDLLVLPVALSAALLAAALALGISPVFDSLIGAFVAFFAGRAFARRSGWAERGARRVAIGAGVVTLILPAFFWLLVLLVFVVGCRGDSCFTF
jgi:cation transport ATPase